jgi:bifunctional non-homologous end joining protein LigD
VARTSTLPKRLQPMLATLTDAPFDDKNWLFEDKYDGFRMVAKIKGGSVTLYSRNGKIISHNYIEVAKALEGVRGDAVIDGELVALDKSGVSHFQLLQNALRNKAKLQYCAFDLMFQDGEDLRGLPLAERKKRLKAILPKHKLVAYSRHRLASGTKFFEQAEGKGLEGIMAKRADSKYLSGARTDNWLKIKTSKRQEVVIAGFTAPRRSRPCFGALTLALREGDSWRYIGHVGTGFSHDVLEELHGRLIKLKTAKSPFGKKTKDEAVTTWVKPQLVAEVKFTEWTSSGEISRAYRAPSAVPSVFAEPRLPNCHLAGLTSGSCRAPAPFQDGASTPAASYRPSPSAWDLHRRLRSAQTATLRPYERSPAWNHTLTRSSPALCRAAS